MDMEYSTPGQVEILMVPYINDIIDSFPEDVTGAWVTSVMNYLFEVKSSQDWKHLRDVQVIEFRYCVATILHTGNQARHDIQAPVAFMTEWVKESNEHDWGNWWMSLLFEQDK